MGKTTEKITETMKQELIALYNDGKMDTEIAKLLNVSSNAIYYWRKKLKLISKFEYSKISKIDNEKFKELFDKKLSDYAIAKELNMSSNGIYSHRIRYSYNRDSLVIAKSIKLTTFQKQVLLGTVLGDTTIRLPKNGINPSISCAHGIKQKEYCDYKTEIFKSLGAVVTYHKRNKPDPRNGIFYEDYTMRIPSNPELKFWYNSFYINNKKTIPFKLFDNFTDISLAFMYMDDGCKLNNTYSIATNCFTLEELQKFVKFLKEKFNIDTTIHKTNSIYIKVNSKNLFTNLISPYFCKSMKYKLHVS